jgi:uroporphyrinogen decarboxylase
LRTANPRENFILAVEREEPLWLPCPLFDQSVATVGHGLRERADGGEDDWGVRWEVKEPRSSSFPVVHPITSPEMVDGYPFPSADDPRMARTAREAASRADGTRSILFGDNGWGLFERSWLLLGMRRFFLWSFRYPDALKALLEHVAAVTVRLAVILIAEAGIDVLGYGDDWGMETGLLFSRDLWGRFIRPHQERLYRVARDYGVLIFQHSDGRVQDLVPDLVDMGVDMLNVQRECNDWPTLIERFGERLTLWGGVSARTLDLAGAPQIRGEVEECCRLGRAGGVVLAPGHSLKYPKENLEVMRSAWAEKGRYR